MMWSLGFLLCTALSVGNVDSYTHDLKERLAHGRQLKIYLPKSVEKLEFKPASSPDKVYVYWSNGHRQGGRGRVSGTGSDRRWYLDHVTYEDEGSYIQRDFFNREISVQHVAVVAKNNYIQRVPGSTLTIPLEGIGQDDATLTFRSLDLNATLVRDGAPVGRELSDYYGRIHIFSTRIDIEHVNTTDLGIYTLTDRRDRVVSTTRLELTDHLDSGANPLMALLLLLGIPAGICCCCRKKIFRKKNANSSTCQAATPEASPGPPPPGYNAPAGEGYPTVHPPPNPGMPGPQWNGPPPPNPGYVPQNPLYPPVQPQPQWSGPPPAQYNPGAPMGYAPVMYSAPPPGGQPQEIKMENMAPNDPLLAHPPPVEAASSPVAPPPAPTTDGAYQFQVDGGKGAPNFL